MTLPTDRSMPPPMITIVTPTVITPITEAEVRIVSRLDRVRNVSAVATPTMPQQHAAPRPGRGCAPGRVSSSLLSGLADGAVPARGPLHAALLVRRAAAHGRRASSGSTGVSAMRGSLHHQVEHPALVEVGARRGVHHPALAHHQHPVGQAEHLGHLAGHQDHRHARSRPAAGSGVDLAARPDVDAAGGFVEQQHVAALQQPAGQHHLLLVAARERAHRPAWGRTGARRAARSRSPTAASSASRPRKPARANRRSAGSETLRDTGSASSRPWLLRSSGHRPIRARTADGTEPGRSARPCTRTVPADARRAP